MKKRLKKEPLELHDLTRIKIGLNLAVNAYMKAFNEHDLKIPEKEKQFIKEMAEAGMREAERLGLT